MGFFSKPDTNTMARPSPAQTTDGSTPGSSAGDEPPRPGTSGTELLLVNNRRRASTRYRDAQRKEREYKNKKRSTTARSNYMEAKNHFKQGLHHNWTGVKLSIGVFKSLGYILRDKNDRISRDAEQKRKLRAAEKQRKLEERLRREKELLEKSGGDGETIADGEAAAAEAS